MTQQLKGTLYDHPRYYDLVFGSDWRAEFHFLQACFERYASGQVRRVFEPACGTGRLVYRLAKAGFETSGLDLNPRAVDYCNQRLKRHGLPPTAFVGDMADFRLRRKMDASFNMINSFRHLTKEAEAEAHLRCMARALRRGGLYVLGIHLMPTSGTPISGESWSARRGNLSVTTNLWIVGRDKQRREERYRMTYSIYTPTEIYRLADTFVFRTYTARQFGRLLARVDEFEVAATHDFRYDIQRPIKIRSDTEDVVYVLRRR
jgi:SAM-dependent methyltransferase